MSKKVIEFPNQASIAVEAADWLIRLDREQPLSDEDVVLLRQWLSMSCKHRQELQSLAEHWDRLNVLTDLALPLRQPVRKYAGVSLAGRRAAAILIATVAIVTATIWARYTPPTVDAFEGGNGLYATAVGQQESTTLSDGSVVLLNTNSQIKVIYDQQVRDVQLLQGEAHFTVAADPSRPFRVFAGNERIQALGTAFSVHLKDDSIRVAVEEGSVSVASLGRSGSQASGEVVSSGTRGSPALTGADRDFHARNLGTLMAGQVAMIKSPLDKVTSPSTLEDVLTLPPNDMARRLAWREGMLVFAGEPLSKVVEEISRYTTVSIEISDAEVRNIRIGGRFPIGETEAMFAALETNFGLQVERRGNNLVVLSSRVD